MEPSSSCSFSEGNVVVSEDENADKHQRSSRLQHLTVQFRVESKPCCFWGGNNLPRRLLGLTSVTEVVCLKCSVPRGDFLDVWHEHFSKLGTLQFPRFSIHYLGCVMWQWSPKPTNAPGEPKLGMRMGKDPNVLCHPALFHYSYLFSHSRKGVTGVVTAGGQDCGF